jgi:hypothetical protein
MLVTRDTAGKKDGKPIIQFLHHMNRSDDVVKEAIRGFRGNLQTDGFAAYDSVGAQEGIIRVGCFRHARSNFFEAKKAGNGTPGLSDRALELIGELFHIEDGLRKSLHNSGCFYSRPPRAVGSRAEAASRVAYGILSASASAVASRQRDSVLYYGVGKTDQVSRPFDAHVIE